MTFTLRIALLLCLFTSTHTFAQNNATKKYPSLFWEITGNGLKKPSYLFGTMHVSNKLAFHLSDSFYQAMQQVDAVALELNPDLWQGQMIKADQLKTVYNKFTGSLKNETLHQNTFQLSYYLDDLKQALSTEPTVLNNLLYRSYKTRDDFEEDTFLDLYIFQTGRKLGKRPAGVEDFMESERIMLQAYADMAKEKNKKEADTDGESMRNINQKIQDAYRAGDLDLMDSLDNLTESSPAFRELFLYKRNDIQANSIDSIVKKSSLFVGIGAAHLAGKRGVIELLRKKGYKLRPIFMTERDASSKEAIDQRKVPVVFKSFRADDSSFTVEMPGPLYKVNDDQPQLDRRQFADMNNGSYYMVSRVKTHAGILGHSTTVVLKTIDSLLYENIPGKILSQKNITNNGFPGFDIVNKTRRGDIQRYQIFVTDAEILLFKMSGKESYAEGTEADHFFNSIQLKKKEDKPVQFKPASGGFVVALPQLPSAFALTTEQNDQPLWEYSATDTTNGNAYLILKKSVHHARYLETDSFNLQMMAASFSSGETIERTLNEQFGTHHGKLCLNLSLKMKDSATIAARLLVSGPHYFVLAARTANPASSLAYFDSFQFIPYQYAPAKLYTDTFMHFSVQTPVAPEIDPAYRSDLIRTTKEAQEGRRINSGNDQQFWPNAQFAKFISDSTGEMMAVTVQEFPNYYYRKDEADFWYNEIRQRYDSNDLYLTPKKYTQKDPSTRSYQFAVRDTGSTRQINRVLIVKDNFLYAITYMSDTAAAPSDFVQGFVASFTPTTKKLGPSVFSNRSTTYFKDLFSRDSSTRTRARQVISSVYFGPNDVQLLNNAIQQLSPKDKDYVESKRKLIRELGLIPEGDNAAITNILKKIYDQTTDTAVFQNEVMEALVNNKSKPALGLFKEIILQDPPVFERRYSYGTLFNGIKDSIQLINGLFPELLQLSNIDDYKEVVNGLLVKLADSGLVKPDVYKDQFSKLIFNAKIALKKQQSIDAQQVEKEKKQDDNDDDDRKATFTVENNRDLRDFASLLAPYYESQTQAKKFFEKLLQVRSDYIKLTTVVTMVKNNLPVPDSVLLHLAANERTRAYMYARFDYIKKLDYFPAAYKKQELIAKSYLIAEKNYKKIDSIQQVGTLPAQYKNKTGIVYLYKYRLRKEDDWKMGLSGIQPADPNQIWGDNHLTEMIDKKIKLTIPMLDQFKEQLRKLEFSYHKTGADFFERE